MGGAGVSARRKPIGEWDCKFVGGAPAFASTARQKKGPVAEAFAVPQALDSDGSGSLSLEELVVGIR